MVGFLMIGGPSRLNGLGGHEHQDDQAFIRPVLNPMVCPGRGQDPPVPGDLPLFAVDQEPSPAI